MSKPLTIGKLLRQKRSTRSLREIGAHADLSAACLHSIENGDDETVLGLKYSTLRKLSIGYGLPLEELFKLLDAAAMRQSRRERKARIQERGNGKVAQA